MFKCDYCNGLFESESHVQNCFTKKFDELDNKYTKQFNELNDKYTKQFDELNDKFNAKLTENFDMLLAIMDEENDWFRNYLSRIDFKQQHIIENLNILFKMNDKFKDIFNEKVYIHPLSRY